MGVEYSPELGQKICEGIAEGLSMAAICAAPDMPEPRSVWRWLVRYPDFLALYDLAKEKQTEVYLDEIIHLADKCPATADAVAKAKLQVHARQWAMGKLKPKKYGDSVTMKGDKDNPLTINVAAALDHAIAQRAAMKTIEHSPAYNAPQLSKPVPSDKEIIESE